MTTWASVSGGNVFSAAVKTDGTLWAWGWNDQGQLGQGNTAQVSSPVQVGSLTTWNTVSLGFEHTYATTTSNALYAWGQNGQGQLAQGDTASRSSPVQVGALTSWGSLIKGSANRKAFVILKS